MHNSSLVNMKRFVDTHMADLAAQPLRIADIGSQDVNGSYKPLFESAGWTYVGIDMAAGKNVDLVLDNLYDWGEIPADSFDIVISGQAFEHIEYFWQTAEEVARILRPGGLLCLIAPSGGFEHRYPVDCWRFYPDGMRALARYVGLEVVEAYAQWDQAQHPDGDPIWQDCVLVARKPVVADADLAAEVASTRAQPPRSEPEIAMHAADTQPATAVISAAPEASLPKKPTEPALPCYEFERRTDRPEATELTHWTLDAPQSLVAYEATDPLRFRLRGWALADGDLPVRVAVRYGDVTRCYRLDVDRGDVVQKILNQEPDGHPKLNCGFDLSLEAVPELEFGFEVDARFTWIYTMRRRMHSQG